MKKSHDFKAHFNLGFNLKFKRIFFNHVINKVNLVKSTIHKIL